MVDIRRVKFNRARVKAIIRDHKDKKKLPPWATQVTVKGETLFIEGHEVVPSEDVETWLRARLYDDQKKAISMSRDSGYTDQISRETLGISRRAWFKFLSAQDLHQRLSNRPKPPKSAGQRLNRFGHAQMDLVEVKSKDTPSRSTDTYIFTLIDRLSSFLVTKRVDTKQIVPKKGSGTKRGTLKVAKELFAELEKAIGQKVHTIESDKGSEFLGQMTKWFEERGTKQVFVPLGSSIEARNGLVQRHLYTYTIGQKRGIRQTPCRCNAAMQRNDKSYTRISAR